MGMRYWPTAVMLPGIKIWFPIFRCYAYIDNQGATTVMVVDASTGFDLLSVTENIIS
jgi:hypothetical protein